MIYITYCEQSWQAPIIENFGTALPVAPSGSHVSVVLNLFRNDNGRKGKKINGAVNMISKPFGTTMCVLWCN